ncbi:MAG TPA: hypothetical protein VFO71_05895 [Gemmatimonadales bacterium]|nr:hypothetical protein [Gemmatimonadales bacterium]
MRRTIDWLDRMLGKWFSRTLGTLCLMAGGGSLLMAVFAFRSNGFGWLLLLPLGAATVFIWLGISLWRYKGRLSEYDWSV